MIITSNAQLRKHLGSGAISASEDTDRIYAYTCFGEDIVRKAIGGEILAELSAGEEYMEDYNPDFFDSLDDKQQVLFTRIEKAVAFYTYLSYLPYSLGSDGDNGLQETKTDKTAPTRMGVLDMRISGTAKHAALAMESVLEYLFENKADFDTWANSDAYRACYGLVISSGKELGASFPATGGYYRLYVSILGFLRDAQEMVATPILGAALMADIVAKRLAGTLSEIEAELVLKTARVVAAYGYMDALPTLVIVPGEQGNLRIYSEFDGINNKKSPTDEQLERLRQGFERRAIQMKAELILFLNANVADFPLFEESKEYMPETAVTPSFMGNEGYTRIFRF